MSAQLADMVRGSSSACVEGFADDLHGIALVAYSFALLCNVVLQLEASLLFVPLMLYCDCDMHIV